LGFGKLTSITAWRDNTVTGGNDVDYTGIDLLSFPDNGNANSTDFKQFSEELRLAGKAGALDWLVGGFFNNEILTTRTLGQIGSQFETYVSAVASASIGAAFNPLLISQLTGDAPGTTFGGTGYNDGYQQTARSFALFTNETWNITQGLDLTFGLRGTEEKKTATASFNSIGGGPGCAALFPPSGAPLLYTPPTIGQAPGFPNGIGGTNAQAFAIGYGCFSGLDPQFTGKGFDQSNTENNLSGTAKLSYRFNEEAMVYASAANGYKAGGFNLSRVTAAPTLPNDPLGLAPNFDTHFPRETVVSGEVGIKTTLFDKTLRLNASLFYQKYTDFQLNTFTGIQFVVTSLNKVVSKGLDVDFAWATPITGLTIAGGITQDLTNIDDFGNALPDFCGGPGNGCTARDNNRLSFAPLWSGALSASYLLPVSGSLGIRTSVEEKYNSSYNTGSDLDPRKIQEGFGLLNARIGFGALDESWAIEAWGANLADKYYYAVAFDSPFQFDTITSYLGAPRTFGLTARVKFK
jgi:outer membrane receptor protein involved in Fe transport